MGKNKKNKKQKKSHHSNNKNNDDDDDDDPIAAAAAAAAAAKAASNSFRSIQKNNNQSKQQQPLNDLIIKYLDSKEFYTMTPVQEATIPIFLGNKDVAVQAVTGSGKTLSFLIPIVERLLRQNQQGQNQQGKQKKNKQNKHHKRRNNNQIAALILSPTRELAIQTYNVCNELCNYTKLTPPLLVVGGSGSSSSGGGGSSKTNHRPVQDDIKKFQKQNSDIIIGTPGRVDDILTRYSVIDVSDLDVLILDEADVLLLCGKAILDPTIASILSKLPKMRRTGLFSATTTFTTNKSIKPMLQRAGMRNPVLINVQVASAASASASASASSSSAATKKQNNTNEEEERDDEEEEEEDNNENQNSKKSSSSSSKKVHNNNNNNRYTPTTLTNYYMVTKLEERISRLVAFIKSHPNEKIIVFMLTCASVDFYGTALKHILLSDDDHDHDNNSNNKNKQLCIELLHGKLAQKRREKAMERYREASSAAATATTTGTGSCSGSVLICTDVAARGLDVPDVDWVIQVDPPQDPSQYVHRVGRSARAGRKGSSLVFLTEKEEAYVDLLSNRQIAVLELPTNEVCCKPVAASTSSADGGNDDDDDDNDDEKSTATIPNVLPQIRDLVLKDRDMLEKGTKAFTSYIRAYKEHVCSFIFRFNSLDLGYLATAFCLLRLPKMPELNDCKGKLKHYKPADASVDIYAIPYLDKVREAARQKRLAAELAAGGKNAKQIKAEMRKAEQVRKQKERRQIAIGKGRNPDKKRGRHAQIVDEWEDLAKEERLYKKLRRGKISKEQYENLIRGGDNATGPAKSNKMATRDDESGDSSSDSE